MTTTILIYDETVTPTDPVKTSTSLSEIPSLSPTPSSHPHPPPPHPAAHVPLPGFIPKPEPVNQEFSYTPLLTTFITHTIPRETTIDSPSSLAVTATSTPSAASALEQSDASPRSSSKNLSTGALIGITVIGTLVVIGLLLYSMGDEPPLNDFPAYNPHFSSRCNWVCCMPLFLFQLVWVLSHIALRAMGCKSRKKQAEPLESPKVDDQGEATPVELDAANEVIGELSAPETAPYHSRPPPMMPGARELEGSTTLSPQ
ncbi:uncharacterized protein Triagg1_5207 [Trichoderma aggressivum f. europaeum]|uniref:Uncharacterized protein n=1 Tax=Trichoderma aggressivum f. europaeum TaxID=173218 RepID=A0AAE1ID83_9HYPO|nr:hypothetical protein Triagg1_5207 [Trichoderma aggressivum f. europaeum]